MAMGVKAEVVPSTDEGFFTGSHELQTDIPHLIDFSLNRKPECVAQANDGIPSSTSYGKGECEFQNDEGRIDWFFVCPPPFGFSSGSHKVVIHGTWRSTDFTAAIEERETFTCGNDGEIIRIGSDESSNAVREYPMEFLGFIVRAIAGVELFLPTRNRGTEYLKKLSFSFVSPASILEEGCELSEEAQGCFLFMFLPH